MRIFKNPWFVRFARKEAVSDAHLRKAVENAQDGLIDADLGGGLIKQRLAKPHSGKSKGWRVIIAFRKSKAAFFLFGFAKSARANLSEDETKAFKLAAKELLNLPGKSLDRLVEQGALSEVRHEKKLPERGPGGHP